MKLLLPWTLTPAPITNVQATAHRLVIPAKSVAVPDRIKMDSVLAEPARPNAVPSSAHWLAGEGAGSWFFIQIHLEGQFHVTRFAPTGEVEFSSLFEGDASFDPNDAFEIDYPCHRKKCV